MTAVIGYLKHTTYKPHHPVFLVKLQLLGWYRNRNREEQPVLHLVSCLSVRIPNFI